MNVDDPQALAQRIVRELAVIGKRTYYQAVLDGVVAFSDEQARSSSAKGDES